MSNFICPTCGKTIIECGHGNFKTACEPELEEKLQIAVKVIDTVLNDEFILEHADAGLLLYLQVNREKIKGV